MILVLASRVDASAAAFAASLGTGATLLLPGDLSRRGWRYQPGAVSGSCAVAGGETMKSAHLTAVLTLLSRVDERELGHIQEGDRRYVAAEMTAFLLAWLTELPCPVINRPQPGCLNGPPWSPSRWRHEAARAGFGLSAQGDASSLITVAGDQCLGANHVHLERAALGLAGAARVEMLSIWLDRQTAFVAASPYPQLHHKEIAGMVRDLVQLRQHDLAVG